MIVKNKGKKENGEIVIISDSDHKSYEHVLQIVSKANALAAKGQFVVRVLIIGKASQEWLDEIAESGADNIVQLYTDKVLGVSDFASISYEYINKYMVKAIFIPATDSLKMVAAILSAKLETGLTADCIDIQLDPHNEFSFHRAANSGTVMAKIKCINCDIPMGTIKKDVFKKEKIYNHTHALIESFNIQEDRLEDCFYEILSTESLQYNKKSIDISQYKIVFGIGRGVGDIENINKIKKIAEYFNGTIAATRGVVEERLAEKDIQVGQSGKSISPRLYIAFGISGASQHMVGIQNAETIIAVNHDEDAPIFEYADYAVVGDIALIINEMEKQLYECQKQFVQRVLYEN